MTPRDSGEREVRREFQSGDRCDRCDKFIVTACLSCGFGGCDVHMAEHDRTCPLVTAILVPPDLAQRILAVLERTMTSDSRDERPALARELRAAVERKP